MYASTLPNQSGHISFCPLYTVKKVIDFPVPSRDVTNQTLPGQEKFNYSRLERVWLVTFRLGTGKSSTFFYSVPSYLYTKTPSPSSVVSGAPVFGAAPDIGIVPLLHIEYQREQGSFCRL
jgi:hypothetical protein